MARAARQHRQDGKTDTRGHRARRTGLRRLLTAAALLPLASRAPVYGRLFWDLIRDERMPGPRKAALAAAAGYLIVGRDLVPDNIPLLGSLDDLVVMVLAVDLFLDGVPDAVLEERLDALGIERRAFEDDVARLRRFTPMGLRRMVRRLPAAAALAGDTLHRSRLGPRVRGWINKEGSLA